MNNLLKKIYCFTLFATCTFSATTALQLNAANSEDDKYFAANALYNKKLYKLAAEEYKAFMLKNPQHPKYLYAKLGLALCYFDMKNYREAEILLDELAGKSAAPNQDQIHNLLGQCLLIAGKPAKAEYAFRWSVNRGKDKFYLELPGVGQATSESPQISVPSDLEPLEHSLAGLTEALYQQGKWKEVVKTASELHKMVPRGHFTPRARFLSALSNYKLKKYKAASKTLQELIKSDPHFPYREDAYFLLGDCQNKLGNIDNAIKNNEIVARQLKGKLAVNALFRMGYIKFMQKEYRSALRDFSDLQALYTEDKLAPEAGIYTGRCYLEMKEYTRAQAAFGALTDKNPVQAKATLWLSETLLRQKKYASVIDILKPALRSFAGDNLYPNLLFNYANALMGQKKYKEASAEFTKVTNDFNEFTLTSDALRMNAFCQNRAGNYRESLNLSEEFLHRFPENPSAEDVGFLRAENLFFLDRYNEAIKAYRKFIPWEGLETYTNEAMFRIASALCNMKKWDDALIEMKPLLQRNVSGEFFEQLYFTAGICEYNLDNYESAIKDFMKFAADYPTKTNADTALLKSAMSYIKLGNKRKAIETIEKLVDTYPKSKSLAQALTELGKLYYFQKEYNNAGKSLKRVVSEYPDTIFIPQAEYYLGWVNLADKKSSAALENFRRVSDKYPQSPFAPDALYQQGMIYLEKKDYAKAQELLKLFLDKYQGDPKTEQAQFYYAITLSRQKKYEGSKDVFKQFIQNNPKSPMVQRALYEAAWRAREQNQTEIARENYTALLKEFPLGDLAERATFELAELEYEAKNYDKSIALLDKLLAKGVKGKLEQQVLYRLAWCFLGREQEEDALETFEQLLKDYPDSEYVPIAAYQAGELRLAMKDFENAYQHYLQSVSSKKTSEVREQALLRLGEAQTLRDSWTAAKKTFETFMAEFPRSKFDRRAQMWRGWCLENLKKYDDAINDYNAVLRFHIRDEISARAQFQIGECFMAMKKYNQAVKALVQVELNYSKYQEWSSRSMLEMGQALDKLGKKEQAIEQYKKVVKKYPGTNEASVATELLQMHQVYSVD
jgi:TolA-binding protein